MRIRSEEIYHKANKIFRRCGTRDAMQIAADLGIYLHFVEDFQNLLGMYTYQQKERHKVLFPESRKQLTGIPFQETIDSGW